MKFIVDAQLPPLLAETLRKSGYDAVAVREIGLHDAKDSIIWQYALENQAIILTKDEDFSERSLSSAESPIIVWLRIGNTTNAALLKSFLPILPTLIRRIEAGDKLIEIRPSA